MFQRANALWERADAELRVHSAARPSPESVACIPQLSSPRAATDPLPLLTGARSLARRAAGSAAVSDRLPRGTRSARVDRSAEAALWPWKAGRSPSKRHPAARASTPASYDRALRLRVFANLCEEPQTPLIASRPFANGTVRRGHDRTRIEDAVRLRTSVLRVDAAKGAAAETPLWRRIERNELAPSDRATAPSRGARRSACFGRGFAYSVLPSRIRTVHQRSHAHDRGS